MKKIITSAVICAFIAASAYSQDEQALAKSDSLFAAGVELYNAGRYGEAIPLFAKSDSIDKEYLKPTSNRRNYSSMWLACCYYKTGKESKAKEIYGYYMVEPVDRRLTVVSDSLSDIGVEFYLNGDYEKAVEYILQCAEIEKSVIEEESVWYANTLSILGECYSSLGNYAEAIRLSTEDLEIRERALGKEHPSYAASLNNLALYKSDMGNYAEAVRLGTEALEIRERTLGKENPDYATSLNNIALYNSNMGNYAEAVRLGTEALEIREQVLGKEHPDYATSLSNIALYNSKMGNYAEAVRLGTEALEIRERTLGKENPDYATSLYYLALYNAYMGNYAEAIRLSTEDLEITERTLGKEHPDYAFSLSNLAGHNFSLGNYAEAVRLETEALEIIERTLGKEHPGYARLLNNLALYNAYMGNYAEAVRLGTEALEIRERVLGKEHPDYATSLGNLALFNSDMSNYTEAHRLGTEALEIRERTLGKEHPLYALSLNDLAGYNSCMGNYAEAVRLGTEALEIMESTLGKEHPDYATYLNNIAYYNFYSGNYAEAISLGTEALEIVERTLGKEHPAYATSLSNLVVYNYMMGNYAEASNYIAKATKLNSQLILNAFSDLTCNERTFFWNKYKGWFENDIPECAYYIRNDSLTATVYDGALLSKGLLLNSEIEMSKLLLDSGDTAVVENYKALQMDRTMLNKLYEKPIAERAMSTDSLEKVIQAQERELVQLSKVYGDYTKNLSINWKQVQERLSDKDVAIEFLSFGARNDSVMYVALTLTKEDELPHLVPLFEKKELDKIDRRDCYDSSKLSELVWKPLADVLGGKENVYFSPAGELHNIAIESIPCYDGEGLMSDRWSLHRLSSTRNLALITDKYDLKRANVYGGLTYDMSKDAIEKDSEKDTTERTMDYAVRTIASTLNLRDGVDELPATKTEAEDIDRKLEEMRISSELLTGTVGTETSFKLLSGKKSNLMHIATHGFYWTESEVKNMDNYRFLASFDDATSPQYVEDKALTRSGLLFAGANYALQGNTVPENVNDGILTAKEISVLDLRGLDLVVLSACQTGLGEITGDGVFGLQRGFKKAGANTLMMSLWKVDDNATQMLMSKFYSNLAKGKTKHDALKDAQRYVREYEKEATVTINDNLTNFQRKQLEKEGKDVEEQTVTRTVKPYESPRFWAAFILLDGID